MSWGTIWINFGHSMLYMTIWGAEAEFEHELTWENTHGQRNVAGLIATIFSVFLAFTATTWFRSTFWHVSWRG